MGNLNVDFAGMKLENPVIVSPGPATSAKHLVRRAAEYSPRAIVLKTGLMEEELNKILKPYAPGQYPGSRPYRSKADNSYVFAPFRKYIPTEV